MLILVRHGQTAANADRLLLGRLDPPLTDLGRAQAKALADALPTPSRLISSPLGRARETAAAFDLDVEVDERWVELDYGEFDGLPVDSVGDDVWRRWRADPEYVPAGGESMAALGSRVRAAAAELVAQAGEDNVVVVTHVSPIKAAVAWALDVGDLVAWRLFVEQAGVCRIARREHGPVLMTFNELYPPPGVATYPGPRSGR